MKIILADKFQYVEQIETAASIAEAAVIFVMLVVMKSSMPVVQTRELAGEVFRLPWDRYKNLDFYEPWGYNSATVTCFL